MIRAILIACLLVSSAFAETARRVPIQSVNIDAREFGVRTGSGVDNADALERLHDYLKASDIRHVVTFPPGLVQSSYNWWLSGLGENGPIIMAYGTQFQSSSQSAYTALRRPLYVRSWQWMDATRDGVEANVGVSFSADNESYGYLIDTVSAGSDTVVCSTASDADNFSAGDLVAITGLTTQGGGQPRNFKYWEYREVASVSSGEITLTEPIENSYDDTWPDVLYGSPSSVGGAPRIAKTSHPDNDTTRRLEIHGAEFLGWSDDPTSSNTCTPYAIEHTKLVDCRGEALFVSMGKRYDDYGGNWMELEVDKQVDRVSFHGTKFHSDDGVVIGGGTSCKQMEFYECDIHGSATSLQAERLIFEKCTGGPPDGVNTFLDFNTFSILVRELEVRNCRFSAGSSLDMEFVGFGPRAAVRTVTSTSTSANHGVGKFAISDTDYTTLRCLVIGSPVWEASGGAVGRVVSETHDAVNDEWVFEVNTADTFSASGTVCFQTVHSVRHSGNSSNRDRVGLVTAPNRDARDGQFVLRITDRDMSRSRANSDGAYFPIGGTIDKVRFHVSQPATTSKVLFLGRRLGNSGTNTGYLSFRLDQAGTREYSATTNTLKSVDADSSGLGFCSYAVVTNNLSSVAVEDLPKFELEIFVNQPDPSPENGEAVTAASPTLSTKQASKLDSTSNAITATLGSGDYVGQIKTIVMTNASNSSTVSVTNHVTSDPEVFTFDAVDEYLVLMWTGTEWVTVAGDATTAILNPWYGTLAAAEHPATYLEAVPCLAA